MPDLDSTRLARWEATYRKYDAYDYRNLAAIGMGEADKEQQPAVELLRRFVDLAAVTHTYGSMGGHDRLGENLSCAGCALTAEAKAFIEEEL